MIEERSLQMRFKQFAAASAAAGLVVLGGASAAQAATASGSVSVQPGSVAPGGQVSVYGLSCTATTGTATSSAFSAPISLAMLANSTGGVGTVSTSAKPGSYPVNVTCGSMKLTGWITVTGTTVPNGGAKTGDGASLIGSGTNEAAGLALIAGALGVGVFTLRRKAKSER
jgi:hypothetical protein